METHNVSISLKSLPFKYIENISFHVRLKSISSLDPNARITELKINLTRSLTCVRAFFPQD